MTAIGYDQALARIAGLDLALGAEALPLARALGRVLAAPVRMAGDQPPFDRATMDGICVLDEQPPGVFTVIGERLAGMPPGPPPGPGQALRIATGACVPPGCTVIPAERTDGGREQVAVADPAALIAGRNVARRGEDARDGALIAAAGTPLTPVVAAALAMAGAGEVQVHRRPRVVVLPTGDELAAGEGGGAVRDSNGPLLVGLFAALGIPVRLGFIADARAQVRRKVLAGLRGVDLVVTTGGVGGGARDFVPDAAEAAGAATVLHGIDMQPGKPVLVALRGRSLLAGLPGNPVSVLATFHLVVLPLLARLWPGYAWPWLEQRLAAPARAKARRLFLPARLGADGVVPVHWNGSGDLFAAAHGDGLIDLPAGAELTAGDRVRFLPYLGVVPGQGIRWPR